MSTYDLTRWLIEHPWTALAAAPALAAGWWARARLLAWRHRRLTEGAKLVTIAVPPTVDPAGSAAFWTTAAGLLRTSGWRRLLHGTPHLAIEYVWSGRALTVHIWTPGTVAAHLVATAARAAWPGSTTTTTDPTPPLPAGHPTAGTALWPTRPDMLPLRSEHDTDPMRALLALGATLHSRQHLAVQVLARPVAGRRAAHAAAAPTRMRQPPRGTMLTDPAALLRAALDLFLPGGIRPGRSDGPVRRADPVADRDAKAVLDKTGFPLWETAIRYAAADTTARAGTDPLPRLRTLTKGVTAAFGAYTGRNRLRAVRLPDPQPVLGARALRRGFLTSTPELASLTGPPLDVAVPGLQRARAKAVPAPVEVPTGGRGVKVLGRAEAGGHAVGLPVADARQHLHVLGSTGSGKSTLLANLVLHDIAACRGVVVIDPKGDLVNDLLDRIPASAADRLVLIDPDQDHTPALNPLSGDDHDLAVDNIVSIFAKIFQRHWGPRIDDVLRVSCHTLLRHAGAALTLIPPLLQDKQFRARFTHDLDDPEGLRGFWDWYETTPPPLRAQVIGPVLARLRSFLLRDFVRRTLGTPTSSFDMGTVLDGGILLARLPKGALGEETTRLLGSFVLASTWQAATARARQPEAQRRDATIVIDEAHNFLTLPRSVDDMLAEARGYRLSMVLAHQHLAQLPKETLAALSANARNKVFFACAPEDAKALARHTVPYLDEHDLHSLDAYTAAARLVIDSRETAAFTLKTRPLPPPVGESTALRAAAAQRFAAGPEHRRGMSAMARPASTTGTSGPH
ncbi:type IV secretion system DNA-binding domain-containing protein [Catellatospora sp. NPDC049111]|uniref:type IV secretion system DNA-binding domain-containing protein n=1 Tax=Catellatospora sp. NPDC049111 TaxID=3155271 RepID=UPI0033EBE8B3